MSSEEVDTYLAALPEGQQATLADLRSVLATLLPDATQGLSYGVPCFKVDGKAIAGFAAYKGHNSYLPMSGSVLSTLADTIADYPSSKGAMRFAIDTPLPKALVRTLVNARLAEVGAEPR